MNEFLPFCIFFCIPTLYLPAYNRGHKKLMVSQVTKKFPALLQNLKIHWYIHLPEPDESSLHLHNPFRTILILSFLLYPKGLYRSTTDINWNNRNTLPEYSINNNISKLKKLGTSLICDYQISTHLPRTSAPFTWTECYNSQTPLTVIYSYCFPVELHCAITACPVMKTEVHCCPSVHYTHKTSSNNTVLTLFSRKQFRRIICAPVLAI